MANKRKTITKKLRFEVFKRDVFTCQYCGSVAPDVILEVDHINPVKNGGDNDILNLITSCFSCNRGKGKRLLNENETLKKQQKQLIELNEKKEQLELMIQWKKELNKLLVTQVNEIDKIFNLYGRELSELGKKDIEKLIKKYGFSLVFNSTEKSFDNYYDADDVTSTRKVFEYISRICKSTLDDRNDPMLKNKNYIRAIIRNRVGVYNSFKLIKLLNDVIQDDRDFEQVKYMACNCRNWSDFFEMINEEYDTDY